VPNRVRRFACEGLHYNPEHGTLQGPDATEWETGPDFVSALRAGMAQIGVGSGVIDSSLP
jgi:hypothetical protein